MCTVWHGDKYKTTFKLVINSRRISRGPVYLVPPGHGPAIEKHCGRGYWVFVHVLVRQLMGVTFVERC